MTQVINATLIAGSDAPRSARQKYASEVYATLHHYAHPSFSTGLTAAVAGGLHYYDDDAWAGLDLIEAYNETGQRQLLQAAAGVLTYQRTGEWRPSDPPDQRMYPGGIYWNANRRFRALNATGATAQLALEVYKGTHAPGDLALAKQEYSWARQVLGNPNGLYKERVDPGGTVEGNGEVNGNGFMIGAGVLLYRATHDTQYLDQAVQTAKASLSHFTTRALEYTCPAFNASYFSNLGGLHHVGKASSQSLDAYAKWVTQHTDAHTGVFRAPHYHCHAPSPQAGAVGTLSLRAAG